MRRPPILLLANQVDGLGGVERVAHWLAHRFGERGYPTTLVGVRPTTGGVLEHPPGPYTWEHLSHRSLRDASGELVPPEVVKQYNAEAVDRLRELLPEFKDGVIIAMQAYAIERLNDIGIKSLLAEGYHIITQYHGDFAAARKDGHLSRLSRTCRPTDRLVLLTQDCADSFRREFFHNTAVIPNATWIEPSAEPRDREPTVVSLSRFDPGKQIDHIVRAWAMICEALPGWRLDLYGDGPTEGEVRALVTELGLEGSVRFCGVTTSAEEVLRRASLSVLASVSEGLPMVLIESLACGTPPVAYDCSAGIGEIVTDGSTGSLVRLGDVAALGRAIETLALDDALRRDYADAGVRSVDRFSVATVMHQWEELIERTLR